VQETALSGTTVHSRERQEGNLKEEREGGRGGREGEGRGKGGEGGRGGRERGKGRKREREEEGKERGRREEREREGRREGESGGGGKEK